MIYRLLSEGARVAITGVTCQKMKPKTKRDSLMEYFVGSSSIARNKINKA